MVGEFDDRFGVGFDRVASWAAARQARLSAEPARRRPADAVPDEEWASAGSRFAPDEVAVALKLSRGTAAGRIATACRLLRVLPDTHALWKSGRIDAAKARDPDETPEGLPPTGESAAGNGARDGAEWWPSRLGW